MATGLHLPYNSHDLRGWIRIRVWNARRGRLSGLEARRQRREEKQESRRLLMSMLVNKPRQRSLQKQKYILAIEIANTTLKNLAKAQKPPPAHIRSKIDALESIVGSRH